MSPKEYLSQAFYLDKRINSKLEQLHELKVLAEKVTTTLSPVPGSESHNNHRGEDTIVKIVVMEQELNADIDKLVDLKREIARKISCMEDPDQRTLLELRYISFREWMDISGLMHMSLRNVYYLHGQALAAFEKKFAIQCTRYL